MKPMEFIKESWRRFTGLETKEVVRTQEAAARDPKKVTIKRLGQAIKSGGGAGFESSIVDLEEVQRAYNTDSYIKRAVDKYADLMFKQGWDFSAKNDKASEYVWTRLKLMAEATGTPTDELLYQIAYDLVLFGNAFVVKARAKSGASASGVSATGYTSNQPVAGYFVLNPTTVTVERDDTGTITAYEQSTGGGSAYSIKPVDMIHFTYKKPTGHAYGIPFVYNVLDDVKILRQVEENVARLVYRNLFPLYVYQVGSEKPGYEATDEEIEDIREQIRDMPMDGGIVVPERHNISTVGSEGAALQAEPYLKYFRERVFTGLGVSESTMGVGGSANKSTSDNQAADLFDGVKEFQRAFTQTFQFKIINEILFEGGFDPILNPDDEVIFGFAEILLDAKIKKENHATQLFTQNVITHEELRAQIGLDPVTDEGRLYFNMVTGSLAQQAADNAMAQSQATASHQAANNAGDNKNQPENQTGKKSSPGNPKRDTAAKTSSVEESLEQNSPNSLTQQGGMVNLTSELTIETYLNTMKTSWSNLRDDVVQMVKNGKSENEVRGFATELVRQSLRTYSRQYVRESMNKGIDSARVELQKDVKPNLSIQFAVERIINETTKYVDRLINDVDKLISTAYVDKELKDRVAKLMGIFNSNEYRLAFIAKTELYRAYNYGRAVAAKEAGLQNVTLHHENGCKQCIDKQHESIVLDDVDLIEALPPHHPNCTCLIKLNMPAEEV